MGIHIQRTSSQYSKEGYYLSSQQIYEYETKALHADKTNESLRGSIRKMIGRNLKISQFAINHAEMLEEERSET